MDSAWWNSTTDLGAMLEVVRGGASTRKLRLYACACIRSLWDYVGPPPSIYYVNGVAHDRTASQEDYVEAMVDADQQTAEAAHSLHPDRVLSYHAMQVAQTFHADAVQMASLRARQALLKTDAWEAAREVQRAVEIAAVASAPVENAADRDQLVRQHLAALLRDVLGDPFSRASIPAAWPGASIHDLAMQAYQGRKFDLLPRIADLLEAGGCNDVQILSHCRSSGPHIRGCWVVDLLLEKR